MAHFDGSDTASTQFIHTDFISNTANNNTINNEALLEFYNSNIEINSSNSIINTFTYSKLIIVRDSNLAFNATIINATCIDKPCISIDTLSPTPSPTNNPTNPTNAPTMTPSIPPTAIPTYAPIINPSSSPSISPTLTPTIIPTFNPSISPSIAPIIHPTSSPSISPSAIPTIPSFMPSIAPTNSPSFSPTFAPYQPTFATLSPSTAPTFSPTYNPSAAPSDATISPSITPTNSPTDIPTATPLGSPSWSPSNIPSISPTSCIDYYPSVAHTTDDGDSYIINRNNDQLHRLYVNCTDEHVTCPQSDNHDTLAIHCQDAKDICYIECNEDKQCYQLDINITVKEHNLTQLIIACNGDDSCAEVDVNIFNANIDNITIVCYGEKACREMDINTNIISDGLFSLHCIQDGSCDSTNVTLKVTNYILNEYNAAIWCYDAYSCDNIVITADNKTQIAMTVYNYSKNININIPFLDNLYIVCGHPDDRRYIEYNTERTLSTDQLYTKSRKEYTEDALPCDHVYVHTQMASCDSWYEVDPYIIPNITATRDIVSCYWADIHQLLELTWKCNRTTLYPYDIIKKILIVINIENSTFVCGEYFGNNTNNTVSDINGIIDMTVREVFRKYGDIKKGSPQTVLSGFDECINNEENIITFDTFFSVITNISDGNEIDKLFEENSKWHNDTVDEINEYFGNAANAAIITQKEIVTDWNKMLLLLLLLLIPISLICVGFVLYYRRKQRLYREEEEKKTINIQNPLIIAIPIGKYEEKVEIKDDAISLDTTSTSNIPLPQQSTIRSDGYLYLFNMDNNKKGTGFIIQRRETEILSFKEEKTMELADGEMEELTIPQLKEEKTLIEFPNLEFVEKDIDTLTDLFERDLNYKINTRMDAEDRRKYKTRWNVEDISSFIDETANKWNIEDAKNPYDSLIVIISCHGIKDNIITSDGKRIVKVDITREFAPHPIKPRIFLFDCCSGTNIPEKLKREKSKGQFEALSPRYIEQGFMNTDEEKKEKEKEFKYNKHLWSESKPNPDYKGVTIHSSNSGFGALGNEKKGSFFVHKFVEKAKEYIQNDDKHKFLYEIVDDVEKTLHDKQIQQIVANYPNETRWIKFVKNTGNDKDEYVEVDGSTENMRKQKKGQYEKLINKDDKTEDEGGDDDEKIMEEEEDDEFDIKEVVVDDGRKRKGEYMQVMESINDQSEHEIDDGDKEDEDEVLDDNVAKDKEDEDEDEDEEEIGAINDIQSDKSMPVISKATTESILNMDSGTNIFGNRWSDSQKGFEWNSNESDKDEEEQDIDVDVEYKIKDKIDKFESAENKGDEYEVLKDKEYDDDIDGDDDKERLSVDAKANDDRMPHRSSINMVRDIVSVKQKRKDIVEGGNIETVGKQILLQRGVQKQKSMNKLKTAKVVNVKVDKFEKMIKGINEQSDDMKKSKKKKKKRDKDEEKINEADDDEDDIDDDIVIKGIKKKKVNKTSIISIQSDDND